MGQLEKSAAVKEFLRTAFPECSIEEHYDREVSGWRYRIQHNGKRYETVIKEDLMERHEASMLSVQLSRFTLIEHLRELPDTPIVVGTNGLSFEYE